MLSERAELSSYAKMEGINLVDLMVDEKIDLSPQKIAALVVNFFDKLALTAVKSVELQRKTLVQLSKIRPLEKQIKEKHPWVSSLGVSAQEKWLTYQKNQLFPQEIIDLFEAIEPGQKEAWDKVLADCLLTIHEDEPRMALFGFLTGLSVSIVQNGEDLLRVAGIQNPTAVTVASQILVSLAGQGIRWKATETYFNVESLKDSAGKAAADLFNMVELPSEYKGTNWQNLTGAVLEKFKQASLDKRLSANIQGLTMGLVSGNALFGNFDRAIRYGLIAMGVNYILGEKYPESLKPMIKMFIDTQLTKRAALEKSRSRLRALNQPTILANLDDAAIDAEHSRRQQATWKNTFQGSVATLLPSFTALITNLMDEATLQSQAFTWSVVASAVLERSGSIMGTQDAMLQGEKAQREILDALRQTLANSERRPPMDGDRDAGLNMTNEEVLGDLVIASVGVPRYISRSGEMRKMLELKPSMRVKSGEIGLIIGGVQTGKSTLLKVLSGRINGNPDFSKISLGETDISRAPRPMLQKIFHVIPLENERYFAARETLARLATEPNVLGSFSSNQIDALLRIKSIDEATANPIIQKFLEFCKEYTILQGKNGIKPEWFVGSSYVLSGSQQALFNLAIATCFDGAKNSKIICADDPTNTLDAHTKQEWRNFIAKRLPSSGHKMLIISNDTHDLDKETGWLAMPNLGSVLDVMSQQAHNFSNADQHQLLQLIQDTKDVETTEEILSEKEILQKLQQSAAALMEIDPDEAINDQETYRKKATMFSNDLENLRDFAREQERYDFTFIKPLILSVTKHALSVIGASRIFLNHPIEIIKSIHTSNYSEFIGFVLLNDLQNFVTWQVGGFQEFPEWYALQDQHDFDSTTLSIIRAQDEIMSVMLGFLADNTSHSEFGLHWRKFAACLETAFNRYAFSLDLRLRDLTGELLFKVVRSGYFDNKERELLAFLSQPCDPLHPQTTIGAVIFRGQGQTPMVEFLALLRYRKIVAH